ncbi:MAG: TetR/AcrR family transcriptional regulator [Spirochaetota bacterium]
MSKAHTRALVLGTAAELFYKEGFRAIGVDTICAASGVGKMTLYRHFESKDDLILAYLGEVNARFWSMFDEVTSGAETAREKILAFFAALGELANHPACHGCPFLNLVVDFPAMEHPGHALALAHKRAVRDRFLALVVQAGLPDPEARADGLFLLMDGAYMAIRLHGSGGPAARVREAAELLLGA